MGRVSILFGMTAVGALLSAGPALSATASLDAQQNFRIASQPLDTALLVYSRQTGLQIISSAPVVSAKVAPALSGVKTSRQALEALLRGSDLSYVVSGTTITIVPAAPMRTADIVPAATLDSVVRAGPFDGASASLLKIADQAAPAEPAARGDLGRRPPKTAEQDATVTVTGSRIVRNGYAAPTPVTVERVAELLETTPTSIADALNKLPELSPQFTQQSNTGAAAPGGNYLNLRGLGQNRTLVLLDGVRLPATNATGTVDTNTLPQALVQRVEVVTGGASAIYGSDAVSGVVNYILNTNFNGFKGSIQSGISTYGDAPSNKVTLSFGTRVSENGHFEVSYEHAQSAGINQSDRSFSASHPGYAGPGTAASPYLLYNNLRMATTTTGGYVSAATGATPAQTNALTAALVNQQFVGTGTLAPFVAGAATGTPASATNTGGLQVGGDGAYIAGGQFVKPVDTDNLFARFDYDLGHQITAYAQVSAGRSESSYLISPAALSTTVISGNPYLPANVQALLTANGTLAKPATLTLATLPMNLINMQRSNTWSSVIASTFGLKGKVFHDRFSWNAAFSHGQGLNHIESDNSINTSHFYAALDAVSSANGPVCNVSTTANAGLYPGCVPLNLLGQGNESPAALAYIMQNTAFDIINLTDDVTASISGTAFHTWAGPVSVSANLEARSVSLTEKSDALPAAPQLTGLRQTWTVNGLKGAAPSTLFLNNTVAAQHGANSVWEVGGEAVVPLLKDLPLAENLEFSGALRYTQYSTSGPAITWKAGLSYQPIHDVRFRVTESRDIRAPTLFDLYQAPTVTQVTITDPLLNNASYTVNQYTQGNIAVKPEVATTNTLGVVYSPSWLPRFRVSLDYYLINIENALGNSLPSIGASGVTADINACIATNGVSAYCSAVPRPFPLSNTTSANQLSGVYSFPINLAEQWTRGLDIEASYGFDMKGIHPALVGQTDLRLLATYSPQNVTIVSPGSPAAGSPLSQPLVTRVNVTVNYNLGAFKASWLASYTDTHHRYLPSLTPVFYGDGDFPAIVTHDLNLSYRFKAQGQAMQASLTINNVFNQSPLIGPINQAPTNTPGGQTPVAGGPSPLGRYYTASLRIGF